METEASHNSPMPVFNEGFRVVKNLYVLEQDKGMCQTYNNNRVER